MGNEIHIPIMFRIKWVYSDPHATILKVEGQVNDTDVAAWTEALKDFEGKLASDVLLDLSSARYFSPKAVHVLRTVVKKEFYLLNCSPFVKQVLQQEGFEGNYLS